MTQHRILHLAGADSSAFYHDLSLVYARDAFLPDAMQHTFAVVEPNGGWRLGHSVDDLSDPVALDVMLAQLGRVDLVVPYMFDRLGMTSYRSFFEDVVGVPVIGSRAEVTALAMDKALTKLVAGAAGIPVPHSYDLRGPLDYPLIVKPNLEDNSRGLTLVDSPAELDRAVAEAVALDAGLIVEEYIPGREIRAAVIEEDGELFVPAMIEYVVSDDHPIREISHKLDVDTDGNPVSQTTDHTVASVCPASMSPALETTIAELARDAHVALGCRDYSLFDFRVHSASDQPYLLEAGLFWTFGKPSMITRMVDATRRDSGDLIESVWRNAMSHSQLAPA